MKQKSSTISWFWISASIFYAYLFLIDPLLDIFLFRTKLGSGGLHIRTSTIINLSVFFSLLLLYLKLPDLKFIVFLH